jgi:hypothetical protein
MEGILKASTSGRYGDSKGREAGKSRRASLKVTRRAKEKERQRERTSGRGSPAAASAKGKKARETAAAGLHRKGCCPKQKDSHSGQTARRPGGKERADTETQKGFTHCTAE